MWLRVIWVYVRDTEVTTDIDRCIVARTKFLWIVLVACRIWSWRKGLTWFYLGCESRGFWLQNVGVKLFLEGNQSWRFRESSFSICRLYASLSTELLRFSPELRAMILMNEIDAWSSLTCQKFRKAVSLSGLSLSHIMPQINATVFFFWLGVRAQGVYATVVSSSSVLLND